MLGPKQEAQGALFYEFSIDDHVPQDHQLRSIDRFVDLSSIRPHLAKFYSHTDRPSIDPELLIRMLLLGYCLGIRASGILADRELRTFTKAARSKILKAKHPLPRIHPAFVG